MKTSSCHDSIDPDRPSVHADIDPVGIWMSRDRHDTSTVELLGPDGAVTVLVQHRDGTIDIRTAAMAVSGQAVRVAPTGTAQVLAH